MLVWLFLAYRTGACTLAVSMAAEAEVEAQVASLKQLLGSKLQAEDAVEFGASDLRLLVRKGYHTEQRLGQSTANTV